MKSLKTGECREIARVLPQPISVDEYSAPYDNDIWVYDYNTPYDDDIWVYDYSIPNASRFGMSKFFPLVFRRWTRIGVADELSCYDDNILCLLSIRYTVNGKKSHPGDNLKASFDLAQIRHGTSRVTCRRFLGLSICI